MARPLPFPVAELKEAQLFGIPLRVVDPLGNVQVYPDAQIHRHIEAAVNWMERELQIDLWPRKVITVPAVTAPQAIKGVDYDIDDDPLDYTYESFYANGYFRTRRYPLQSIEKVELRFPGDTSLLVYPKQWLRINRRSGQVNIVAIAGVSQPVIIGQSGGYLPFLSGGLLRTSFPQIIYVDYTSGIDFASDENKELYADLFLALQQRAAMGILAELGRGIRPGLTSLSLSEDGQSQSQSLARGQKGVYGAEIAELEAAVKEFVSSFKATHKGPIFVVL